MEHSTFIRLSETELTKEKLRGAKVHGPDNETVGTVSKVEEVGLERRVIIDVGGFLGIGTKRVALDASRLNFGVDEDGHVHGSTAMTKDEMKNLSDYTG